MKNKKQHKQHKPMTQAELEQFARGVEEWVNLQPAQPGRPERRIS